MTIHEIPLNTLPTFRPIFGKIVVKIDPAPERKYGQLVLPQRENARSTIGTVHAVYATEETPDGTVAPQVAVGDKVIFGQFTGTLVAIGRELFVICKEHDLLTVVEFPGAEPEVSEVIE